MVLPGLIEKLPQMLSTAQTDATMRALRARFPGLLAAWLYGSAATGRMRPDSDVYLTTVRAGRKPPWLWRWLGMPWPR